MKQILLDIGIAVLIVLALLGVSGAGRVIFNRAKPPVIPAIEQPLQPTALYEQLAEAAGTKPQSQQCAGITKAGARCKRRVRNGQFCPQHKPGVRQ